MKKIIHINTTAKTGSTGRIAMNICELAEERGYSPQIIYSGRGEGCQFSYSVQGSLGYYCNNIMARLLAMEGMTNYFSTKRLLRQMKREPPQLLHLHNLHGHYLHAGLLFRFIREMNIPVVWTLHDCWSFTGGCAHFTDCDCEKWKMECGGCNQCAHYPIQSRLDRTKSMLKRRKQWFRGVENLTIVTPAQWLADLVRQSFLGEYPIRVIRNGIDLRIFSPSPSALRERYDLKDKKLILGVSFGWSEKKGLQDFVELSRRLPEEYKILLVGVDEGTRARLPQEIIALGRTSNAKELAEIYSAADLFVNPTREEVLPLVNLEANACGTPVLTYDSGGSRECINKYSGAVVPRGDLTALEREILRICTDRPYSPADCRENAKRFDHLERARDYLDLYEEINDKATGN